MVSILYMLFASLNDPKLQIDKKTVDSSLPVMLNFFCTAKVLWIY